LAKSNLHKILFYSDFSAFGLWGKTITNAEYQHLEHGPAVYRMLPVQEALKASRMKKGFT
jgi:Antitoxin SocA-like, Panacea domain